MRILFVILITSLSILGSLSYAAPYGAIVMNAKNGEVLHCQDCDTKLHPAGLTKLVTLYVVFSKIENGEITLDEKVKKDQGQFSKAIDKLVEIGLVSKKNFSLMAL